MSKSGINIIGGKYRGKKIAVASAQDLRPTPNRIRETLFNWLAPYINGLHTLDLFAGSGLLSFEALSRGAASATLLEKNKQVCLRLKNNASFFKDETLSIHCQDAISYLKHQPLNQFDLIFIDAPFASQLCYQSLAQLAGKLKSGCLLYIEHGQPLIELPIKTTVLKQKKASQVHYQLHQTLYP